MYLWSDRPILSLVSEWLTNNAGLQRCNALNKLIEAYLGVTIQIEPSHNVDKFLLGGTVPQSFQESSQRELINHLVVQVVYGFEDVTEIVFGIPL